MTHPGHFVSSVRMRMDRICTKLHLIRYKEIVLYILVGGGTTAVDWILYTVFVLFLPPTQIAFLQRISPNILAYIVSWAGAVTFAYSFSRLFVFESSNVHIGAEILKFVASRLLTLAVSIAGDMLFCGNYAVTEGANPFVVKAAITVLVIVLNYVLSKLLVFRRKE